MIQFMTLDQVEPFPYRHLDGMGIKMRFVGGDKPAFVYQHQATAEQLGEWNERIGQEFPVRTRTVIHHDRSYLEARVVSSLRPDPRKNP